MWIISDSDKEIEYTFQEIVTAAGGTVWTNFDEVGAPGRLASTTLLQ